MMERLHQMDGGKLGKVVNGGEGHGVGKFSAGSTISLMKTNIPSSKTDKMQHGKTLQLPDCYQQPFDPMAHEDSNNHIFS